MPTIAEIRLSEMQRFMRKEARDHARRRKSMESAIAYQACSACGGDIAGKNSTSVRCGDCVSAGGKAPVRQVRSPRQADQA
jgi:hypothetical protein